ncbi:hypothetical protein [Alkalicoccobacillus porphyridii]|uniref:Uncharacterized protein n=1 Tax=Alkalicoccobacillus porphyridii TaxID=2597270 RepID=A0A554A3J2_9BACI|nr:hypothetical protein [Alkalicoccobacillus porphyridii]TSB48259.1 hypothetical protein FN960_01525 [Alkalicoccobacillus porphyridii]
MLGLSVITGMLGSAITSIVEKKIIEEPIERVFDNALNKFIIKNDEEKRNLNLELIRGVYRSVFKALKRINSEVIEIVDKEGDQSKWVANYLKEINKKSDKKLESIIEASNPFVEVEKALGYLSSLDNLEKSTFNKKGFEEDLIELALSIFKVESEIYENRVKTKIFSYTRQELISQIINNEEFNVIFSIHLNTSTNEKVKYLVGDSKIQNNKLNEIKSDLENLDKLLTGSLDRNSRDKQNEESEHLIIEINNKNEMVTSDKELFILINKAHDILMTGKTPIYIMKFHITKLFKVKLGKLNSEILNSENEEIILKIREDFRDYKTALERKEREAKDITNMLRVLYMNKSLYSYLYQTKEENLMICIKNIIEIGLGTSRNSNYTKGTLIEAYASQKLPSIKFSLTEEKETSFLKEDKDYILLRFQGSYFLFDLHEDTIVKKAIPAYLQIYCIFVERHPELKSDHKFNDLFSWYVGLA